MPLYLLTLNSNKEEGISSHQVKEGPLLNRVAMVLLLFREQGQRKSRDIRS
jgi:hypothetical protein